MLTPIAGFEFRPAMWMVRQPMASDEDGLIKDAQKETFSQTLSGGLRLFAIRCGILGYDFSGWPAGNLESFPIDADGQPFSAEAAHKLLTEVKLHRAMVCNVHLICLYATRIQQERKIKATQIVGPNDLQSLDQRHIEPLARSALFLGRGREVMWHASLRDAADLLDTILQRGDAELLALLDLYARSIHALDDHNYGLAVSLAWTVTEKLLTKRWLAYIEENRQRSINGTQVQFITNDRKDLLMGRDYTASVKIEILSLLDLLPLDLYRDMKGVRQGRNNWMHALKPATLATARQAVDVARRMLAHAEGVDLTIKISARLSLT